MKKICIAVMAIMILAATVLTIVPAGAEATEKVAGPLVITEIFNNPATYEGNSRDYVEYMEIMNIGDTAIDLYEYKFWYTSASTLDACPYPTETNKWNVFATKAGENVLQPGEIVVIWFITGESILASDDPSKPIPADVWYRKSITEAEKADYAYTYTDYLGNVYAYNVEEFKNNITAHAAGIGADIGDLNSVKIIPWDVNIDFEKPTDANIESGFVGVNAHFNMANCSDTKAVKYWVTSMDVTVFDENTEVICTAGVHSGGKWSNQAFHYSQTPGSADMTYLLGVAYVTPGFLYESMQGDLINLRHTINPEKYPETVEIVTTTEEEEDVVTTEEITNPPRVTTAPEKPSTTTKPSTNTTTKAPETTATPAEGGCGGFTAAAQLFALVVAAAAFVVIKKK